MDNTEIFLKPHIHRAALFECAPDWRWNTKDALPQDCNLWVVLRGRGEIRAQDALIPVDSGTAVLIFPHTVLSATHVPTHPLHVLSMHFGIGAEADEAPPLAREIPDFGFFRELVMRVLRLYNAAQKRQAEAYLTAALAEFFSAPDERAADRSAAHTRMIWEICDRIHRSAAAIPTLAETAREYGYSSDYLGRLFHQVCGVSYSAYAANTRINLAKTMLTETERSLGEIAEALGYYDAAYFCRQFRQLTGTAPGKFRRGRN